MQSSPITFCTLSSCFCFSGVSDTSSANQARHQPYRRHPHFVSSAVIFSSTARSLGVDRPDALLDFHQNVFGFLTCRPPYQPHKRTDGESDH